MKLIAYFTEDGESKGCTWKDDDYELQVGGELIEEVLDISEIPATESLHRGSYKTMIDSTAYKKAELLVKLKEKRDSLLKDSDRMVLPDYPSGSNQAILDYRQALRDMPDNHTTLAQLQSPTWPEL